MLDFPNSPTVGSTYTNVGKTWQWDGTKWVIAAPSSSFPDAPTDGNTYGRQNNAWTSVSPSLQAAQDSTGRNLLHNGTFIIQQRGTGPFAVTTANGYLFLERWYAAVNGTAGAITANFVAITDAQRTAIGDESAAWAVSNAVTGSATAGTSVGLGQDIEGPRRTANKTITVSFWAWVASGTRNVGVSWQQYFGSGGSPSATVNGTGQVVVVNTTPTRYSVTFSIPSVSGKTFGTNGDDYFALWLFFSAATNQSAWCGAVGNQSGTFSLYGVQLEIGTQATPLDAGGSSYQQILAACQRFYQTGTIQLYGSNAIGAAVTVAVSNLLPVTMRATPTVAGNFTTATNVTATGFNPMGASGVQINAAANASSAYGMLANFTASADL